MLPQEMYTAIKHQQILQPLNTNITRSSVSSLSPGGGGMMRNRSLRGQPDRLTTLKRGSIRGLQSILSVQSGISPYSSNSSIDGRVSPSPSFATSTHEVRNRSRVILLLISQPFDRLCMVQAHPSSIPHLALLPTYHTPSSVKLRKMMIEVFIAKDRHRPQ